MRPVGDSRSGAPRSGRFTRWLDAAINAVSPSWGTRRAAWRKFAVSSGWSGGHVRDRLSTLSSTAPTLSPDEEAELSRLDLIDTARELEERYEIAEHILNTSTGNVIGPSGMRPQARSADPSWNQRAEMLWKEWAKRSADVRGLQSFASMQKIAFRARLRDGDVAAIKLDTGKLQLVEADLIDTPIGRRLDPKTNIVEGVELDDERRPIHYYVRTSKTRAAPAFKPVAAHDVIFTAQRCRANQTRGRPLMNRPLLHEQLMGYLQAIIVAARMAACFGLAIHRKNRTTPKQLPTVANRSGTKKPAIKFEPGMALELGIDEKISGINPGQPTQSFDALVRMMARIIGLPAGLPIEAVLLDFSESNFSSSRGAMLEARARFRTLQIDFIDEFLEPIWRWKVDEWIRRGVLPMRDDAFEHTWQRPAFPYIDPVKEVEADGIGVALGFKTRRDVIAQQGEDWEETFEQLALEESRAVDLGLEFASPTKTRGAGAAAADSTMPADSPDDDEEDAE